MIPKVSGVYYLYKISIRFYYFLIRIAAPFNSKAKDFIKAQGSGLKAQINYQDEGIKGKRVIWFHASSLGEYEQGLPLIEEWKARCPTDYVLLTFYSPSGYKNYNNNPAIDRVEYLPKDIPSHVKPFLDHFNPKKAIFIKYDIWPVLMRELKRRGIPSYLVSSVFRKGQLFFKWYGKWYLGILKMFKRIFVQDENSAKLLQSFGLDNYGVAGDTRIDRVIQRSAIPTPVKGIEEFCESKRVVIAGSSWPEEEDLLYRFITNGTNEEIKLILCPHDVGEKHLKSIRKKYGSNIISYTELIEYPEDGKSKSVLLIDRIGLLGDLYRYGHIAVIGGAFGMGLHNILEPAVFGLPVIFGPFYYNFIEAVELVKSGGGFSVRSYDEFYNVLSGLISYEDKLNSAGEGCRRYVENSRGATALIISCLLENNEQ